MAGHWLTAVVAGLSVVSGCTAVVVRGEGRDRAGGSRQGSNGLVPSNLDTSLTALFNNTLDFTQDFRSLPFLILDAKPRFEATAACGALDETVLNSTTVEMHESEVQAQLAYQGFAGYRSSQDQVYQLSDGIVIVSVDQNTGASSMRLVKGFPVQFEIAPVLCSNAQAIGNSAESAVATPQNQVVVRSESNTFVGYRNQKSFRFLGIPYAAALPQRWVYSQLNPAQDEVFNATAYGSECAQTPAVGSEDCLFLNIQTPHLPLEGDTEELRPVFFWIHGGAFTGGTGADPGSDGGQLASREDVVTVTINYRLSTLGFLAVPGTNITGNYGISDQVTALDWTIRNIAFFGGDPRRITIIGESAGAGSVRILLGSPKSIGKFQGAVAMSNLGGGVMPSLGFNGDFATTYSSYPTIAGAFATSGAGNGQTVLAQLGCPSSKFPTLEDQVECLRGVPADTLVDNPPAPNNVFRYPVEDGIFINTEQLDISNRNGSAAHVPVIFGIARDDGASFDTFNRSSDNLVSGIAENLAITTAGAQKIVDSGLFPLPNPSSGNLALDIFNVSSRISTDIQFRCVDEATVWSGVDHGVFPSGFFYEMTRTYGGFDPNDVGSPPVVLPQFPNGDPNLPYFRTHGADMPNVFGDLFPIRDPDDLLATQLISSYFASFARTFDPNPPQSRYRVLGYSDAAIAATQSGPWLAVDSPKGPIKMLDAHSSTTGFQELPQCAFLGYSIEYYDDVSQDRG